jgi:hypothetical protein
MSRIGIDPRFGQLAGSERVRNKRRLSCAQAFVKIFRAPFTNNGSPGTQVRSDVVSLKEKDVKIIFEIAGRQPNHSSF